MAELSSWESHDGAWHVLGAGDLATVRRALSELAAHDGQPAPEVRETELQRRWVRRSGSSDSAAFIPCRSTDARAELLTSWTAARTARTELRQRKAS